MATVTDRFFQAFDELTRLGVTNRSAICRELGKTLDELFWEE